MKVRCAVPGRVPCHGTGCRIDHAAEANAAFAKVVPITILPTLAVIMVQRRSFSATFMTVPTAPPGLVGAMPILLGLDQPFGFNAIPRGGSASRSKQTAEG